MSKISVEEYHQLAAERLPFAQTMGLLLQSIDEDGVWMRACYSQEFLRPGGTVAGPVMMGLADAAIYALVLSRIGPVELAVTTSLNINFLRKPAPGDILARATALKIGKRLAIGEVSMYSAGRNAAEKNTAEKNVADDAMITVNESELVAHATATYSIPPVKV